MPRWLSLVFLGLGLFIVLLSLDVVHHVPRPGRARSVFATPHHWSVTAFGLALMAIAPLIAFPRMPERWRLVVGAIASLTFLAAMAGFLVAVPLGPAGLVLLAIPVAIGGIGVFVRIRQLWTGRIPFDPDALDPLEKASILRTHGRPEQADEVLLRAMRDEPHRAPEFQRALDAMRRRRVTPGA